MPKKFYEIDTCGQFHKTFWRNSIHYWHTALSLSLGYGIRGVNYAKLFFYEIDTCGQFHKTLKLF
jgi:hypothetical protein